MQRHRIINIAADAGFGKFLPEFVAPAILDQNGVLIVNMRGAVIRHGRENNLISAKSGGGKEFVIFGGVALARLMP